MNKNLLKKDRMRFVKNKMSANLVYLSIIFNVLYFVSIYSSDVANYYYSRLIGVSVIYNLLFFLSAFLCSEGLKNYKMSYSIVIAVVGLLQFVRILGFPTDASNTVLENVGRVMEKKQQIYTITMLCLSGASALAAGAVGLARTLILEKYKNSTGNE